MNQPFTTITANSFTAGNNSFTTNYTWVLGLLHSELVSYQGQGGIDFSSLHEAYKKQRILSTTFVPHT